MQMHTHMYQHMHLCGNRLRAHMHVCVYVCMYQHMHLYGDRQRAHMYVCIYVCMYPCLPHASAHTQAVDVKTKCAIETGLNCVYVCGANVYTRKYTHNNTKLTIHTHI
jgi:hypothetical protein